MISVVTRQLRGSVRLECNRLPKFRAKEHSQTLDSSLLREDEREGYGYETGFRVLPYLLQDSFTRDRRLVDVKTVVLENRHLRAEFWPQYGARLASLYDKDADREILYSNKVLQFADLAIRKAWFSGGIEWNIGQLGHTFTTCDDVFMAVVDGPEGQFLRAWEYERCKGLFWNIDFHLADDDDFLSVYVRAVNPRDVPVPFYWWTNTAVPEEKGMRVFSGTDGIIYIDHSSLTGANAWRLMAHGCLPQLDGRHPGRDYSYPESFDEYSNEYFFQNRHSLDETWEGAGYRDGRLFFERSSTQLCYRKLFCWGGHQGGRHWRDYLSDPGEGDYVELQAGFCRTQLHGMDIAASSQLDFVQFFGSASLDGSVFDGEWKDARDRVYAAIDERVDGRIVNERLDLYRSLQDTVPERILHTGSGWGRLELERGLQCPQGLVFPPESIAVQQLPWLGLLKGQKMTGAEIPVSFITDLSWRPLLESACDGSATMLNLLGVMLLENGLDSEAEASFERALQVRANAFSLRCLSQCAFRNGDEERAMSFMDRCCSLSQDREYDEEYLDLLCSCGRWDAAWAFYSSLGCELKANERIMHAVLPAALEKAEYGFLRDIYSHEPAVIREGNRVYSDGWFVYQALEKVKREGTEFSPQLVQECRDADDMPFSVDFRQG